MNAMNGNTLVEMTPGEWGLLVYLSKMGILDLDDVKVAMKDVANFRIAFAEKMLWKAKRLVADDPTDQLIVNRSYYCMYHAARAAVYVQMQLDVTKHQILIAKFKKLLTRTFNDAELSDIMDAARMNRNECDYNPSTVITMELCERAIEDAEAILAGCKKFVEDF